MKRVSSTAPAELEGVFCNYESITFSAYKLVTNVANVTRNNKIKLKLNLILIEKIIN